MGSSLPGLLCSFAILTSALSLLPSLSPISSNSTGISNYNNQTLPDLMVDPILRCDPRYGKDMSVASCRSALQKIPRSSESHRFARRRKKESDQMTTPIRYLSDDGICAIVRYPCLLLLCHSISMWFYKAVIKITRAVSPCLWKTL